MAAELVGGAFLSASLQVLFDRMASQKVVDVFRGNKLNEGLLRKLEVVLRSAKRVLNDAEMKQLTDLDVREWLEELKDAIYKAEDLVYEIDTEALRSEIEDHSAERRKFFKVSNRFSPTIAVKDVEARMVEIVDTVEHIMEQKKHLGLVEGSVQTRPFPRLCEATLVEESDIYGRDADKEAIIKLLLSESDEASGGSDRISVISIVGMGGIGKTTLAQSIYRTIDGRVMTKPFDIKAWITVSEESDVFTLTKAIYEAVTKSQNCTIKETLELQLELKDFLEGKKFLLVLDDVWNVDYTCWCKLKSLFESATSGSKIIATTRIIEIASVMTSVPNQYHLKEISEENSWRLFEKHAFYNIEPSVYQDLEKIGRQIVQKCKGLPLAVKSLGGLLRSVQDPKDWEDILTNDVWNLPKCDILPALWLSYYHLPPHLKRCFAYCSIYPKDYVIEKEDLILLWMAEDLLQPQNNKIVEEVGEEYFKDLTSRSFFHSNEYGKFIMHDLVNDLAKFVSGESCFRFYDSNSKVPWKTRHLSCLGYNIKNDKKLKDLSENKVLRTLLLHNSWSGFKEYIIHHEQLTAMKYLRAFSGGFLNKKLLDSIGTLKLLRYLTIFESHAIEKLPDTVCTLYNLQTLRLSQCHRLFQLPDSIGKLKHLRYLDLSSSRVEKLPDTICNLHNLHTLDLDDCRKLTCLPTNLALLVNLRNLKIGYTNLKEMPPQMSKLKYLQVLTNFVVGKSSGSNIKELGKLQNLSGRLHISCLENGVNDVQDVLEAYLKDKKNISQLKLEWNGDADDSSKAREILHRLEPAHANLKEVEIVNYQGTSFPNWVGHHSFSCIKQMSLFGCKNCYQLPPLGQLSCLEYLMIEGFDMVEGIGPEFYSDSNGSSSYSTVTTNPPFKSLRFLTFKNMPQWKEWCSSIDGALLNLESLVFWGCSKLNGECLPDYLPSLTELRIWSSEQLFASLSLSDGQCPSLQELLVCDNPKMESFPPGGRLRLPSNVKKITISYCEQLVSFSEEGWPPNLKSLRIFQCDKLLGEHSMTKWNLQMLTSLTELVIGETDKEIETFPEKEGQLPTTLTSLELCYLVNLKSLNGSAFRHLTSLQSLSIKVCDQLQSLPEEVEWLPTTLTSLHLSWLRNLKSLNGKATQRLHALKKLSLFWCFGLETLPEETLPASLLELDIRGCHLLKPRCRREIGEYWPKIAHIPRIYMD